MFLDEIGDMPPSTQAKLLRVLEEREFYPVGSEKPVEVDVRLIAATNKTLEDSVKKESFREDLYYRIHVLPIELPPLWERRADIAPLVEHFLKKIRPADEKRSEYINCRSDQDIINEDFVLQTIFTSQEPFKPLKEARDAFERGYLIHLFQISECNVSQASKLAGKYRADFYDLLKKLI